MTTIPRSPACVALCAACILLSGQSFADDLLEYKIGGFGSFGGVMTDLDGTKFRTGLTQFNGASKHVDLGVDSRLGLQSTLSYGSDFALTAQLLGTRRSDVDFDVAFEWLYLQYTGVPGLDLKAGRMALPTFLVSDSRFVGYSTPWLRVPPLVYSMMPVASIDGYEVAYRHTIGPVVTTVQALHGQNRTSLQLVRDLSSVGQGFAPVTLHTLTDNISSVNITLEWKDWTARLGKVTSDVTQQIGSGFSDSFDSFGLQYDNGKLLTMFEYVQRRTNPTWYDSNAWYAGVGYRIRWFMPYAVVSGYRADTGMPRGHSHGLALGLRHDFATNVAMKTEIAQYGTGNELIFTDAASPAVFDKKVNVLSVSLDFVF